MFTQNLVQGYWCMLSHSVMSDSLQPHGLQTTRVLCPGGFSRQEYWSGLLCPPPGDLPNPGIEPRSLMSPALQADSLPSEPPGKPTRMFIVALFMVAKWFMCPADEQTKPSIPIGWNIQLKRAIKSWFMLQHEWTLEMKLFTSNWDLDPHGWDSSPTKPMVFQLISHPGVSGPKEAQVVDVLSQKEFSERQSDRCAAC